MLARPSNTAAPSIHFWQAVAAAMRTLTFAERHAFAIASLASVPPMLATVSSARAETALAPAPLMAALRGIETDFGRTRGEANEARILDLDILAYGGMVSSGSVVLPHPRLHQRAFVLLPLREVAPDWLHPVTGRTLDDLIAALPRDQVAELLGD